MANGPKKTSGESESSPKMTDDQEKRLDELAEEIEANEDPFQAIKLAAELRKVTREILGRE